MFPDRPIGALGQKVLCDLEEGLVCRNQDQIGIPGGIPMCYNYEINVYCCGYCSTTTTTVTSTPTPTPTTTTTTHSTTTTPVPPTTTPTTTPKPPPESSSPPTSQSTSPSITESTTPLTTSPTTVKTTSIPSPPTETKPVVTTPGSTTSGYCTGWGDPHYVTFDGLYYSYQGNCTYVLVEEVRPTVDNFGVYIDNYHCDVNDQVSCPRTLIVRHETQEVLIKTVQMAPMRVQVQVNKQAVALPYKKYGLQVYESGINYVVNIPELDALISYNGLSFTIRLPYRLFGNNTKGHTPENSTLLVEGCFCPEGTMNYAPGFDVCVEVCGCVGPDNVPREFGEHFEFDCKDCVCLEGGSGIVCQPKKCSQEPPAQCKEDGTYLVTEVNPADTCCNITFCMPKGVCVVGNAEYQPGSPVYSSKCETCVCTNITDSATQLNHVSCSHVPCPSTCNPPGDMKSDPKNNCTFFSCVKIHNQLISSVSNITCPDFDPSACLPGSITLMPNGCCKKCIPRNETKVPCSTISETKEISEGGCTKKVLMNYCSGSCGTFAM
ncbi:Mucin-2 [Myotis davidii]|uniref:Mucin-2 n=1 Tax=Myotis davidii TaxID=225400 RepID=L5MJ07_MYODS|nr:Mucin-2 [Myotis davidii]